MPVPQELATLLDGRPPFVVRIVSAWWGRLNRQDTTAHPLDSNEVLALAVCLQPSALRARRNRNILDYPAVIAQRRADARYELPVCLAVLDVLQIDRATSEERVQLSQTPAKRKKDGKTLANKLKFRLKVCAPRFSVTTDALPHTLLLSLLVILPVLLPLNCRASNLALGWIPIWNGELLPVSF